MLINLNKDNSTVAAQKLTRTRFIQLLITLAILIGLVSYQTYQYFQKTIPQPSAVLEQNKEE
ncbi:hypothetical protein EV694_0270 [Volucribacter psittacicida]|uniref:Uncharacterized protein n=1 Tax=Volucribacter psittacicida TaxID=203482 RepID=A0A4R1GBL0_9PAST|nr:hypothetical protein EV694_0270 [Volucribacter psittacicida]